MGTITIIIGIGITALASRKMPKTTEADLITSKPSTKEDSHP